MVPQPMWLAEACDPKNSKPAPRCAQNHLPRNDTGVLRRPAHKNNTTFVKRRVMPPFVRRRSWKLRAKI